MKQGLLWYDDSPGRDLADKVRRAATRYEQRFGQVPNVCYVHPSAQGEKKVVKVGDVRIALLPTVLRHHFWIGRNDEKSAASASPG